MTHPNDCYRCETGAPSSTHLYLPRVNPQLTWDPASGDLRPRVTTKRPHVLGRPQHVEPGRGLPLRVAYASLGLAVICVAVYLLAGHWFGQAGQAAVFWLLHTAALLLLAFGGLALFASAMPDSRDVDDG